MQPRRARTTGSHARPLRSPGQPAARPRPRATTASRTHPDDLRRTFAAAGSAIVPGLGQLLNGRRQAARWFAIPILVLVAVAILFAATRSPAKLFASIVSPTAMSILLALNVVVLVWRVAAVIHAFFDGRYPTRPGQAGAAGLAIVLLATVIPHGVANAWGTTAQATFAQIFAGDQRPTGPGQNVAATAHGPGHDERLNILVIGIDKLPWRTATLTDSMMVVSIDPVGETVSMVSLPRDLVKVPLGDGNVYGPKLNSLMSYADRHPETFPQGGTRALEDAVGALLGIPIHYYAKIDFFGFVKLVDAVGGVDINVKKGFNDPKYDGIGINAKGVLGYTVKAGLQHMDGWHALAYSRSRYALGQTDFARAARQQEVLLAIRSKVMAGGSLLTKLPDLLVALGGLVTTDLPTDRLPDLAAVADDMAPGAVYRMVLNHPLVKPYSDKVLGSSQIPDLAAIQEAVANIMPAPGGTPIVWSPDPTAVPKPTSAASPAATGP